MQTQQHQNHQDSVALHQLMSEILSKQSTTSTTSSDTTPKMEKGNEFILEALASNISEFCYDAELNLTFDSWYARY
ncbi:hypothetical protein CVS40_11245 [Lucilia cuprina]|nr:hypothetical protein CVS40_11245 [Lucilia cuprina]